VPANSEVQIGKQVISAIRGTHTRLLHGSSLAARAGSGTGIGYVAGSAG